MKALKKQHIKLKKEKKEKITSIPTIPIFIKLSQIHTNSNDLSHTEIPFMSGILGSTCSNFNKKNTI